MHHIITIFLSLTLAIGPSVVWADEPELSTQQQERLVRLIEEGKTEYDAGRFEPSLEKFRQAYDLYAHPDIVYRMALCYERLGEDQQAVQHYRQFLREAPDAPERARIEKTIEVIESRISKSEIRITTVPEGAIVYIDDEANGAAGFTPTALAVKPGNYKLIVTKEGYEPIRELVTVTAGQSVQVRYQLTASGEMRDPEVTKRDGSTGPRGPSVKLVTLATLGIASGITSVVFFGLHADKRSRIDEIENDGRQQIRREEYEKLQRQAQVNLIVAVSTVSLATFSLIWAYAVWQSESAARASASGPSLGWSDGPVAGWQWRF